MSDRGGSRTPVRLTAYESWSYQDRASSFGVDILLSLTVPSHADSSGEPPNGWFIALGDVAGKGEAASLRKDRLEAEVLRLLGGTPDPAMILHRLDTSHCDDESFPTLV